MVLVWSWTWLQDGASSMSYRIVLSNGSVHTTAAGHSSQISMKSEHQLRFCGSRQRSGSATASVCSGMLGLMVTRVPFGLLS